MLNALKMPSYEELVGLSNGELTTRTALALKQLMQYDHLCTELTVARKVYETYKREQQKRLLVGKRFSNPYM
jgi:hypothetical protein